MNTLIIFLILLAVLYLMLGIILAAGRPHWSDDLGKSVYASVFPLHALLITAGERLLPSVKQALIWFIRRPPNE